jgi:hypothetical protein
MIGDYNVSNTLTSEAQPAEKGWGPCACGGCRTALEGGHPSADGLVEVEVKLSAYRRALRERVDACTAQLVDHYQRGPAQIVR